MTTSANEQQLRTFMRQQGIQAFITPSTDPHAGEYIPERWKSRRWISGFTGSAGTAVVTLEGEVSDEALKTAVDAIGYIVDGVE